MWVPSTAEEIERAAVAGSLEETASFDAKADLPKKNAETAKDIAAMATDGGVLLYGVAEDSHGRPAIPQPLALAGAADRIGQIVDMSIAEVPHVEVREIACADDPSRGYIVVIVPQSARAPHQVTVGGDLRFYGRGPKGNRLLTEADVARLYARRQRWEVSRDELLAQVIADAPIGPDERFGYVHAFSYPVAPDPAVWDRAEAAHGDRNAHHRALAEAISALPITREYSPSLRGQMNWRRVGADTWRLSTWADHTYRQERFDDATTLAEAVANVDGRIRVFCGRATDNDSDDSRVTFDAIIAGTVASLFALAAKLYEAGGYHGELDAGVALTNIKGARSYSVRRRMGFLDDARPYGETDFSRTARFSAGALASPEDRTRDLLGRFFEASTGIDGFDPFAH